MRPDGSRVCFASTATDNTCLLDVSGVHTVVVSDATDLGTGGFVISIQRLDRPRGCGSLSYGASPTAGALGAVGQMACFSFGGAVGGQLLVRAGTTAGTLIPTVEVEDPTAPHSALRRTRRRAC